MVSGITGLGRGEAFTLHNHCLLFSHSWQGIMSFHASSNLSDGTSESSRRSKRSLVFSVHDYAVSKMGAARVKVSSKQEREGEKRERIAREQRVTTESSLSVRKPAKIVRTAVPLDDCWDGEARE